MRTRNEFTSDVRLLLGPVTAGPAGPDEQDLTYQVTNRWVFLSRVIELGTRVRLQGRRNCAPSCAPSCGRR